MVLALLDGMVNELGGKGFFAQGVDLQAWNSVAGHSKGLAVLSKIMGASRNVTTVEPLTIPYRNGILHGMDLGYDNATVAAKAWAALFAARDWAVKKERKEIGPATPPPRPTLRDLFQQMADTKDSKRRLARWEPRTVVFGADLPASGTPEEYGEDTPERKLAEYLGYWRRGNFGGMAGCVAQLMRGNPKKLPHDLRTHHHGTVLEEYTLTSLHEQGAGMVFIEVELLVVRSGREERTTRRVGVLNEDAEGNCVPHGKPGSRWAITTPYLV